MDQQTLLAIVETVLRIALGLRFLYSGVTNILRWPNPVRNAEIVFSFGTKFFGALAVYTFFVAPEAHASRAALLLMD